MSAHVSLLFAHVSGMRIYYSESFGRKNVMQCWHLTHCSDGRYPLFPDEQTRRSAARKLSRIAGDTLVLFCAVEDHVHTVVQAERARAGRLAQAIAVSLQSETASPVQPTHIRPVARRSHMEWLVTYILTQPKKHDTGIHPALWSGSCFPDLAGTRYVEGMELQIGRVLPRFRIRTAYEAVGLPPGEIPPARDPLVRFAGAARLASAAGFALAVGPFLSENTDLVVLARRAVVQISRKVGISEAEVAWALGISRRTVKRNGGPPVREEILRTIRRCLALENLINEKIVSAIPRIRHEAGTADTGCLDGVDL